ncbi:MAG TPA: flagellar protein FliT [Burkholderiaceae bacterium]|nr:flagellar protein FliT [Burkholderiaceae bacterium]
MPEDFRNTPKAVPPAAQPVPVTIQRGHVSGTCRLIERYENLETISRAMLEAARAGCWDEVARLEQQCVGLIEELKAARQQESLSHHEQWQRITLLRKILAHDAEIRERSEPWLMQLEMLVPGVPVSADDWRKRPAAPGGDADTG